MNLHIRAAQAPVENQRYHLQLLALRIAIAHTYQGIAKTNSPIEFYDDRYLSEKGKSVPLYKDSANVKKRKQTLQHFNRKLP